MMSYRYIDIINTINDYFLRKNRLFGGIGSSPFQMKWRISIQCKMRDNIEVKWASNQDLFKDWICCKESKEKKDSEKVFC